MTDPNYTALLLIVDRSGSMQSIRDEMVGALTALLADQAAEPGMLTVDVVLFDHEIIRTHSLASPAAVDIELTPRGSTALHDALGIAATDFGATLAALPEHARPSTVQVVVVTDGHENASQEWSAESVRHLVRTQIETYSWDFVYLGANQDAVLTARQLGFDTDSAMTYAPAAGAIDKLSMSTSRYLKDVRGGTKKGFTEEERGDAAAG